MVLAIGTRLGSYEIVQPLGRGGMGEVYRARDRRLDRDVAIKILPEHLANDPDVLSRFEREARAVASLSHPNIVVLFDLGFEGGVRFAVMELLQGETLRAQLNRSPQAPAAVAEIGAAIADALSAAHARGIVHRDIKPENVFVTTDGRVKVLDFGVARVGSALGSTDAKSPAATETAPGTIIGTLAYMSPEQVLGETARAASDIFSLGSVLYEMATGRPAFVRPSPAETIAAILRDTPPRIDASLELDRVVARCLAKSADERFPSAAAAAASLRLVTQRPAASKKARSPSSIAVLPFVNSEPDAPVDYLCDGITESLINHLSEIPKLRVVPRSTVFRYKGAEVDLERATLELDARVILTGRVVLRNDVLNVQAELVDATARAQLWGRKYSRKLEELSEVEDQIAREIVGALRVKLSSGEKKRLARRPMPAGEAYQLYLKGRHLWNKRTRDGLERAIAYFRQAIDADPSYALAYVGLADCYGVLGTFAFRHPQETLPQAKAAARHALAIDDGLAEAHVTLAVVSRLFDFDHEGAEREFARAFALNPSYAVAHQWYGTLLCLNADFARGLEELREALRLEPLSPMINVQLGAGYYLARRYEEAVKVLTRAVEFEPDFWPARYFLGTVHAEQRNDGRALAEAEAAVRLSSRHPLAIAGLGRVHGLAGRGESADELLDELRARSGAEYVSPYHFATILVASSREGPAVERVEECVAERSPYAAWFIVEPSFDPLRADPRFRAVVASMSERGAHAVGDGRSE